MTKMTKFSDILINFLALILIGYFSLFSPITILAETIESTSTPTPTVAPLTEAPEIIYPYNGQTLDLEGGYMFKVNPVAGASEYLLRLSQDGQTIYETLSSNGEFGVWEDNPAHAKFHAGEIQVLTKAQVSNVWTADRIITITLKSRKPTSNITPAAIQSNPTSTPQPSSSPNITPNPSVTAQPTPTSSPVPSAIPSPSPFVSSTSNYHVKAYLVYPADKIMYPEYESAVRSYLIELQNWYKQKVGKTFNIDSLQVVQSKDNYSVMRCGENPSSACLNDASRLDGNVGDYVNKAIHQGIANWDPQTATLIFAAGAGGYAGANKYPNDTGWAIVGDWVLEPISGKTNDWGIPCKYSGGWQCGIGVAKGTPAHELGHAFGLGHPDPNQYPGGHSIMIWHGDYSTYGFLPFEIEYLNNSPFFQTLQVSPTSAPIGIGSTAPIGVGTTTQTSQSIWPVGSTLAKLFQLYQSFLSVLLEISP